MPENLPESQHDVQTWLRLLCSARSHAHLLGLNLTLFYIACDTLQIQFHLGQELSKFLALRGWAHLRLAAALGQASNTMPKNN
eukprot:1155161-Pelagomonas_calceolata.AAC.4